MVRQRPVVRIALAGLALAMLGAAPTAPPPPSSALAPAPKAPAESIDRRPYKIRAWVAVDPAARIDARGRANLVAAWRALVHRFVGSPWDLEVADGAGPLSAGSPDTVEPQAIAPLASGCDKAWMIRIEPEGGGFAASGREYDVLTQRLGPTCRRPAPYPADVPRVLLALAMELFAPTAEIGAQSGGGVSITVRGASLPAASPAGRVVATGSVFRPLRVYQKPDGSTLSIEEIRRSFLRVEELDGPVARCAVVSSLRDPLSRRAVRKNVLVALGVKPTSAPTRLRYLKDADKTPAAGLILTARPAPDGIPRELGITGRDGRVVLAPGFADGLVIFRLLAANIEPLDEFPAMPGETAEERTILINTKPQTVALETQLNALRDELIDLVAVRARIESRLKARAEGEKWDEVATLLDEYRGLTPREQYVARLAKLKDDAARKQEETKTAILTKTARALITDTQALIDRYLDDEIFKAYDEALARSKADEAKGTAKGANARVAAPLPGGAASQSAGSPVVNAPPPKAPRAAGAATTEPSPRPSPAPPAAAEPARRPPAQKAPAKVVPF